MRRLNTRNLVTYQDISGPNSVCPRDPKTMLEKLHAQEENGPILVGAAAFAAMWRATPSMRWLGLLALNPTFLAIAEWAYVKFLRYRPRIQKWFK